MADSVRHRVYKNYAAGFRIISNTPATPIADSVLPPEEYGLAGREVVRESRIITSALTTPSPFGATPPMEGNLKKNMKKSSCMGGKKFARLGLRKA